MVHCCLLLLCLVQVRLPLDVGTHVDCLWRDGQYHAARIIERRKVPDREEYDYYVHYRKCESS